MLKKQPADMWKVEIIVHRMNLRDVRQYASHPYFFICCTNYVKNIYCEKCIV